MQSTNIDLEVELFHKKIGEKMKKNEKVKSSLNLS